MRKISAIMLIGFVLLLVAACGKGGTETGTSDPIDATLIGSLIQGAGSALVPDVDESGIAGNESAKEVSYRPGEDFSAYLEGNNVIFLTNIFGPKGGLNAPETRIRVQLDWYQTILDSVFGEDPNITCAGATLLDEGDSIDVPFFGGISNGEALDRRFKCIVERELGGSQTGIQKTLYGSDASNVVRVVHMQQTLTQTSASMSQYGSEYRGKIVVESVYSREDGIDGGGAYLDHQYAQALVYNGADHEFDTADDVIYKNRSRITGRVTLDANNTAGMGRGDFTITKYDLNPQSEGSPVLNITKTIGRGAYNTGDYSLFDIDVNAPNMSDKAGIYCIKSSPGALPSYAGALNCTGYESQVPWSGYSFPFDLSPAIDELFESKQFFEGNDTDLISNSGDNFIIPDYRSLSME